jgi:hypothetical protein
MLYRLGFMLGASGNLSVRLDDQIGRAFGKGHGSIRFLLTQRGGIVPDARRRSLRTLTLAEREDISRDMGDSHQLTVCDVQIVESF